MKKDGWLIAAVVVTGLLAVVYYFYEQANANQDDANIVSNEAAAITFAQWLGNVLP